MGCVPVQLPVDAVSVWPCTAEPAIAGGDVFTGGEEACLPEPEPPEPEACLAEELRSCVEGWRRTHRLLLRRRARWRDVRVQRAAGRQLWRGRWCCASRGRSYGTALPLD